MDTAAQWIVLSAALVITAGLTAIDIRRHLRGLPPSAIATPLAFAVGYSAAAVLIVVALLD